MNIWRALKVLTLLSVSLIFILSGPGLSEEPSEKSKNKGLNFAIPDDWPVEERGGMLVPVPVEEYASKRFKEIEEQLKKIEDAIVNAPKDNKAESSKIDSGDGAQIKEIVAKMEALAQDVEKLQNPEKPFLAVAESQPPELETKLNGVERNLSSEIKLLKKRLDDLERQIRSIEFHLDI